jgi:phospholipid/cholesterol/gamma-HCH transport system permease protein
MLRKITDRLSIYLGKNIRLKFLEFTGFAAFLKITCEELILFPYTKEVNFIVLLRQILFTGFEALRLIIFIGLVIGGTIIIQGMTLLDTFGQSDLVYSILIIIITKELGPLLTAFIIISRSGTSISTELGNMVVNHEIEALTSIGIKPIRYLVIPRILGVVISLFCLNIYFNISGLIGGYLVSLAFHSIPITEFFSNLFNKLTIGDLMIGQLKSLVFGFIIGIIACYNGLKVKFATTEVPVRTINSVVSSLTWIFITDIIIVVIFYSI